MEGDIVRADDYLGAATLALNEARSALDAAASVFVEGQDTREQLGNALGRARNAVGRASADVKAHVARAGREGNAARAHDLFKSLPFGMDGRPQLSVAIVPLPLEPDRVDPKLFGDREFQNAFTRRVVDFNNRYRRGVSAYLLVVPGGTSPIDRLDHFEFLVHAQGDDEPWTQVGRYFPSGMFVFNRVLYCSEQPQWVHAEFLTEAITLTLSFAMELYEDVGIHVRTVAAQAALLNAQNFEVRANAQKPQKAITDKQVLLPRQPAVLPLPPDDRDREALERSVVAAATT
jgi:hypothetical protein